jgi:hypothetical protein
MFDERTPDFSDEPHADQALGIGDTPPGHFDDEEDEFEDGFGSDGDLEDSFESPLNDAPVGELGGPESDDNLDDLMDEEFAAGGGTSGGAAGRRQL